MPIKRPSFIVGIGGSAGGLRAYEAFLAALPGTIGMAYVFVSHMLPSAHSLLANLLSKRTKMPVLVASAAIPIQANHVYVIPPDSDLLIEGEGFEVISPRTRRNAQIDLFLASLAESMGARAIGIILSGYDGDGTEGCRSIKAKGGITFAQDMSAEVRDMPLGAFASGFVDFVLPPEEIPRELKRLAGAAARKAR